MQAPITLAGPPGRSGSASEAAKVPALISICRAGARAAPWGAHPARGYGNTLPKPPSRYPPGRACRVQGRGNVEFARSMSKNAKLSSPRRGKDRLPGPLSPAATGRIPRIRTDDAPNWGVRARRDAYRRRSPWEAPRADPGRLWGGRKRTGVNIHLPGGRQGGTWGGAPGQRLWEHPPKPPLAMSPRPGMPCADPPHE